MTSRPARLADLVRSRRVRDRIDRDYAQPLDVGALARGAHMSAGHLSREFRAAYGETVYSYLIGEYRRRAAGSATGLPPWVAEQVTRPVRNREAPAPVAHLA